MTLLDKRVPLDKLWAMLIGCGLALMPIHNRWLTRLTEQGDEVGFFIPAFGTALWLIGALCFVFVYENWHKVGGKWKYDWRALDLGDKRIYIPLLVIVLVMGISGITADSWGDRFSPVLMGCALFTLYLATRKLGKEVFLPLAVGVAVASFGVIFHGLIYRGQITGGFMFEGNYDIVVGYVLLGGALFIHRGQWLLAGLSLMAMFFSGSPEAVFAVGVMAVVILWRERLSRRLVACVVPTVLVAVVWFGMGYGQDLYAHVWRIVQRDVEVKLPTLDEVEQNEVALVEQDIVVPPAVVEPVPPAIVPVAQVGGWSVVGWRIHLVEHGMANLRPLGDGYSVTAFKRDTVHNVPLIIVQQLGYPGILAALAWLWVSGYCLVKTRWKYAWLLLLALGVFDHFTWTQMGAWWWCLVGVSTASDIKADLIFKELQ